MFEFFRLGKKVQPVPQLVSTPAEGTVPGLIVPGNVLLKPKKWVVVKGRVGIVTAVDTSGYVKIAITNQDGITVETIRVPVGELRLARYMEIPESRRGSQVVAATLGYV